MSRVLLQGFGRFGDIGGMFVAVRRKIVSVMFVRMSVRVVIWRVMPMFPGTIGHVAVGFAASFMPVWQEPAGMRMAQFDRRQHRHEKPGKQKDRNVRFALGHRS